MTKSTYISRDLAKDLNAQARRAARDVSAAGHPSAALKMVFWIGMHLGRVKEDDLRSRIEELRLLAEKGL